MTTEIKVPKKLIEVALPLDSINAACAYEKMPGIGAHPRGIHLWWARRPLAAARAVIFAQMVNDPGYERHLGRGVNRELASKERQRLFKIIEDLVKWENKDNAEVLRLAREEIWKSWKETCSLNKSHKDARTLFNPELLPEFHDPFAGGGAIPLEAQRLGLGSTASDLNPVAVLINKSLIEIPSRFNDTLPVGPVVVNQSSFEMGRQRSGPKCLAEDLRRYSNWIKLKAEALIGDQYPKTTITKAMSEEQPELKPLVGRELTNIAWLWARTVKSPNPAFSHVDVPLVANFVVCRKDDQEVYVQPIVSGDKYRFKIVNGKPPIGADQGTKQSRGANFTCIMSGSPIEPSYIYKEAQAGRMGTRLMAIVAEGPRRRIYLAPTLEAEKAARVNEPKWRPETLMPENPRWFSPPLYGLKGFGDLFTARQLVALTTLSDLVTEAISQCEKDAISKGMANDGVSLDQGGKGARAYSQAVGVYLSFVVDRCADFSNSCTRWVPGNQKVMNLYGKQAIGMTWDFPEAAILENTVGGFIPAAEYIADCLETLPSAVQQGRVQQEDAADSESSKLRVVSTDPPYYDNIGYADLSDFFYPWLRRSLGEVFPKLFSAESVPKAKELVATPYRHGGKANAETFFLNGMTTAIENLAHFAHPAFPVTIYYARQPLYSGHSDYIDIVLMFNKSPRWTIAMASAGAVSPIEPCILSSL